MKWSGAAPTPSLRAGHLGTLGDDMVTQEEWAAETILDAPQSGDLVPCDVGSCPRRVVIGVDAHEDGDRVTCFVHCDRCDHG